MLTPSDYQPRRVGPWELMVLPGWWNEELQECVIHRIRELEASKHPQTIPFHVCGADGQQNYFIKLFHCHGIGDAFKDLFRVSKPKRFWNQGLALSAAGFLVPTVVAVGEVRHFKVFRTGFVLTFGIPGQPLPVFLRKREGWRKERGDLKLKRDGLVRLADLVRQFHSLGFVHGDLIANNLLVALVDGQPQFYFMDNDRTSRFPHWWPARGWKRNLVQLNRMPLPGVTLQDRMRFFCRYLGRGQLSERERRLVRWLEEQTRRRRYECDGVGPRGDFRRLMRFSEAVTSIDR
jgi:lipopolysaccharide kinase (Kdo/WaaP) family protein